MELAAELAKGDTAARSETLIDTAPVIEGNKVVSLTVQSAVRGFSVTLQLTISSTEHFHLKNSWIISQTVLYVSFTC